MAVFTSFFTTSLKILIICVNFEHWSSVSEDIDSLTPRITSRATAFSSCSVTRNLKQYVVFSATVFEYRTFMYLIPFWPYKNLKSFKKHHFVIYNFLADK